MSAATSTQPVSLKALLPTAQFLGSDEVLVSHATERSDLVSVGSLFAAIPGTKQNGQEFARDAVQRGATALLLDSPLPDLPVPQCIVPDVRRAFATLCDALAGHPSEQLRITGVTGTNGKTTTTWLIRSILRAAGHQTGVLGTIEYSDGVRRERANLTTPDSSALCGWLQSMVEIGSTHAAMELSSHALDQGRACGTLLDVGIVTNVTQDHFDYHKNYETYLAAKARIAEHLKPEGILVLNADDRGSSAIVQQIAPTSRIVTFGLEQEADLTAKIVEESTAGTRFVLACGAKAEEVFTPLIGRHNVANCLAAAAATQHFGIPLKTISLGIELLCAVPGRFERVVAGQPFDLFVDFAHTQDALLRCVTNLRQLTTGRLIVVFGAGGDRDRSKRPKMAQAVLGSDLIVVTSDNPRTEDPQQIIADILAGFSHGTSNDAPPPTELVSVETGLRTTSEKSLVQKPQNYRDKLGGVCVDAHDVPPLYVEPDRRAAIRWALEQACPGDCLLIAGKGHETEQIIGTERFPFDDREVAQSAWHDIALSREAMADTNSQTV